MTALTVRLPNSIHAKIRELAARDAISVNRFIASAAACIRRRKTAVICRGV